MTRRKNRESLKETPIEAEGNARSDVTIEAELQETSPQEPVRSKVSEFFLSVLSGNILSKSEVRRAYPYMLLLATLAFIYIAGVFRTQYLHREYSSLSEEVRELRARSMTIASQRMIATRQSNIQEEIKRRNIPLQESLKPNKVIPVR